MGLRMWRPAAILATLAALAGCASVSRAPEPSQVALPTVLAPATSRPLPPLPAPTVPPLAEAAVPPATPTVDRPLAPRLAPPPAPGSVAPAESAPVRAETPLAALPQPGEAVPEPAAPELFPIPDRPEIGGIVDEFCSVRNRSFAAALDRGERYLPMIRSILAEEGLPEELAYVPLIESNFEPRARSSADAVGLWQFIESTARASGLRVDWWVDERLDPEAATHAAARHLNELFARFGDWDLALAAYNAGPGGVDRALAGRDAGGFWDLAEAGALRPETRRYVPKFYAAVQVARDPAAYGFPPADGAAPVRYDTVRVDAPVDLTTAARLAGVSRAALVNLNPSLRRGCTPPGGDPYPLHVPAGTGDRVARGLATLPPAERVSFQRYRVRAGDTLWQLSRRYGTPTRAIAELNGITDVHRLKPGLELAVPVPTVRSASARPTRECPPGTQVPERAVHVVRPGDTVWGVARRYSVEPGDLLRWNNLGKSSVLRPGDRLTIAPSGTAARMPTPEKRVHVVQEGESLWGISRRYGVPLSALMERNGLGPSSVLRPGDRLVVGLEAGGNGPS